MFQPQSANLQLARGWQLGRNLGYSAILLIVTMVVSGTSWSSEEVDFALPDPAGQVHRLSDFRGEWVIVNFWATWCAPCLKEIPDLIELSKLTEPVSVVVIGIDFEEIETAALNQFIAALKINYLILRVGESPLIPFEPLKGLPTTFIVSPAGHIVFTKVGATTKKMLLKQLQIEVERYVEPRSIVPVAGLRFSYPHLK